MLSTEQTWLRKRRHVITAFAWSIVALCFAMNDSMSREVRVLAAISFFGVAFLFYLGGRQAPPAGKANDGPSSRK